MDTPINLFQVLCTVSATGNGSDITFKFKEAISLKAGKNEIALLSMTVGLQVRLLLPSSCAFILSQTILYTIFLIWKSYSTLSRSNQVKSWCLKATGGDVVFG